MPAFKFKLPTADDLKAAASDPKRAFIEHGEKLVVLACVVVLLLTIVGLFSGGGGPSVDRGKMERAVSEVNRLFNAPAAPDERLTDPVGNLKLWEEPVTDTQPWDTFEKLPVVTEVIALTPKGTRIVLPDRHPDIEKTLVVQDVRGSDGQGWLYKQFQADRDDLQAFQSGQIRRDVIRVYELAEDKQFAVVYGWFDMRPVMWDFAATLSVGEAVRQGARPRMPDFDGLEVEREDAANPGRWEPVEVPLPKTYEDREAALPAPTQWQPGKAWPPLRPSPWTGGRYGLLSIIRTDPVPAEPDHLVSPPAPATFRRVAQAEIAGGIYLNTKPDEFVGDLERQMNDYVNARAALDTARLDPAVRREYERLTSLVYGLGIRFVDTTVRAQHTYRYRVAVRVKNPCVGLAGFAATAQKPEVLVSQFSAPSAPVAIPPTAGFWLRMVVPTPIGTPVDRAQIEIQALHEGRWRVVEGRVCRGDRITWTGQLPDTKYIRASGPPGLGKLAPPGASPGPLGRVTESVTLDTHAVLLDIVPVETLRAIYPMRAVVVPPVIDPRTGRPILAAERTFQVRDWLALVKYLPAEVHKIIYQTADGQVGANTQGEMPEYARERARAYADWLRGVPKVPREAIPPEMLGPPGAGVSPEGPPPGWRPREEGAPPDDRPEWMRSPPGAKPRD